MTTISYLFIISRNASNNTACINHEFEFDKLNQIKWTIDFPHTSISAISDDLSEFTFK